MQLIFYDFEILKQDWFVSFYKEDTNEWFTFRNNRSALLSFILKHKLNYYFVGFNSSHFDDLCLKCIWYGLNPYIVVKHCIRENKPHWTIPGLEYKKNIPNFVSIDLMQLPKMGTLKEIEGNLGLDIIECDLADKDKLSDEEYETALKYNKHDVYATYILYQEVKAAIDAKEYLIETYHLNKKLFSSTIPAIGKSILGAVLMPQEKSFIYQKPNCIEVENQEILNTFNNQEFTLDKLIKKEVNLNGVVITLSLGGAHGGANNLVTDDKQGEYILIHADAASLYPNEMDNEKNPEFNFLSRACLNPKEFRTIKQKRLEYKKAGKKAQSEPLKLVINSIAGAMLCMKDDKPLPFTDWVNNRKVCITGQLALTMLVEWCNKISSFNCFNLNTDGIWAIIHKDKLNNLLDIFNKWMNKTGLELSMDIIKKFKVVQKDVNNYIIYDKEKNLIEVKGQDVNKLRWGKHYNNSKTIMDEAMIKYFVYNKPINETIQEAYNKNEVEKFQIVLNRKGKNYTNTYYGDKIVQKVNRVFPTYDITKPPLTRMKDGSKHLFPDAPEHVIIDNRAIKNIDLKAINLDLNYYFNIINKKIEQWLGKDK